MNAGCKSTSPGHAHHQEHLTAQGFEQIIQGAAARTKGSSNPPKSPSVQQRYFSQHFGFTIVEIDPMQIQFDFYDVLNTREKAKRSHDASPRGDRACVFLVWCQEGHRPAECQPSAVSVSRRTPPCSPCRADFIGSAACTRSARCRRVPG